MLKPILALDIGGTNVRAAAISGGQILGLVAAKLPSPGTVTEDLEVIRRAVTKLELTGNYAWANVAGVATAASVNSSGHVTDWPNRKAWVGLNLRGALQKTVGNSFVTLDDGQAAVIAEAHLGAARGMKNVVLISLGTGIACGIIVDDRLLRGRNGWAGEMGHWIIDQTGPPCGCGRSGCLQAHVSGRRFELLAHEQGVAVSEFVLSAGVGHAAPAARLRESAVHIGMSAANLVNLLDLEGAIIGGHLVSSNAWWQEMAEQYLQGLRSFRQGEVPIKPTSLGSNGPLLGAAIASQRGELA